MIPRPMSHPDASHRADRGTRDRAAWDPARRGAGTRGNPFARVRSSAGAFRHTALLDLSPRRLPPTPRQRVATMHTTMTKPNGRTDEQPATATLSGLHGPTAGSGKWLAVPVSTRVALVDEADYPLVSAHRWSLVGLGYAQARIGGVRCYMHRLLLGVLGTRGVCVDHINGDKLDNRRANLRACSPSENIGNNFKPRVTSRGTAPSSRFKGVGWNRTHQRWRAAIGSRPLGDFRSETEAAIAYDAAARKRWGAFARVNFPLPGERGIHAAEAVAGEARA